jgi:hypothetical protein
MLKTTRSNGGALPHAKDHDDYEATHLARIMVFVTGWHATAFWLTKRWLDQDVTSHFASCSPPLAGGVRGGGR